MDRGISKSQIFDVVLQHVYEVLPELQQRQIQMSDSLRDLGANSLDRADIVMEVMNSLSIKDVPRIQLLGPRNIGELVELIHENIQRM